MMPQAADKKREADSHCRSRDDVGTSFIEVLISMVLLGTTVVAVLTALSVTIRGSDQHKSKVGALAELEGAGAYLNRVANEDPDADCNGTYAVPPAAVFDAYLTAAALSNPNPGVTVAVTGVSCTSGIAEVTLTATHVKQNATETLSVTVGGITVLEDGDIAVGPPPPSCTWGSIDIDNRNPERKPSGRLDSTVTVTLSYTGDCTTETASLTVTNYGPPGNGPLAMALTGTIVGGEFEYTFAKNHFSPWVLGPVLLSITTSDLFSLTDNFTVI